MDFIKYLIPTENFAIGVVIAQFLLFFYCCISFFRQRIFLSQTKKDIESCHDVTRLSTTLLTSKLSDEKESAAQFYSYTESTGLTNSSPVYHHLKTLFNAGFNQSNLDVQALLKNTSAIVTNKNQIFRSIISLFIVLGLLGTLWGLASSLFQLSVSADTSTLDNKLLTENFRLMLSKLSGAFAPSIWGVGLTIFSVGLFISLQKRSQILCLLLERETLGNWGLYLLPTTSQHLYKQLQRNEEQLQINLKSAHEVEKFAKTIEKDAEGLANEVAETRLKFKDLRQASENLIKFSEKFGESLVNFPTLQTDLHKINQQVLEDSTIVRENFARSLADSEKIHQQNNTLLILLSEHLNQQNNSFNGHLEQQNRSLNEHFEKQSLANNMQYILQGKELNSILASLKLYEASYLETRKSIDETLLKTLFAVEEAHQKLGQHNESVIKGLVESVGNPLREELTQILIEVPSILGEVSTKLGQTHIPLDLAAERMSAITEKFDNRTEDLVGGLQREFASQNLQDKKYLEDLKTIKENISSLNSNLQIFTQRLENFSKRAVQTTRQSNPNSSENEVLRQVPPKKFYDRFIPNRLRSWIKGEKR